MRDDPVKNVAVVQAVCDIPELFDRNSTVNKKDLEKMWHEVGKKSHMSGHAARDRWRIIRGSYVRYLKQADTEGAQKKEYYLAKYLGFLRPHIKIRDSVFKEPSEPGSPAPSLSPSPSPSPERKSQRKKRPKLDRCDLEEPEEQFQVEAEEIYCAEDGAALTYTLRNGRLEASTQVVSNVEASTTATAVHEEDPDLMFFKSLLPDMSSLPSKKKNKFKITVMSALVDLMED